MNIRSSKGVEPQWVKIGQPTYHKKRQYFTMKATGDVIHEVNLDYLTYPLIPTEQPPSNRRIK